MEDEVTCLEHGPDCHGKVEYRITPDRSDMKAFPRCEFHFEKRLEQSEKNLELMSDIEPSWFDPTYAGERWSDDY